MHLGDLFSGMTRAFVSDYNQAVLVVCIFLVIICGFIVDVVVQVMQEALLSMCFSFVEHVMM